ncbi:RelA/SpoT domain-containing protein [Achromobacter mucicolens]|uniref:RelA/SpoT domain-containing protein n=1 Tax=Achromobacter mucicolens TaxID=1389922 RepID=UPI0020A5CC53|nr:RelA/SpoT domain-containing protein [Achromobacter mucicolens]MCP2518028.1 RelA/SpoT domain-containing protein [Achromobacter mucicolens]
MTLTRSKIDRAEAALAKDNFRDVEDMLVLEEAFDEYRKSHLEPLSETTLELQAWLNEYGHDYYIAQRLKRKPQIIRKLNRLSVRLTQLQDIGGCRIIVEKNELVDRLVQFLKDKIARIDDLKLTRVTDYREKGRDVTGYRSVHLLLERSGRKLELQLRSRIQHYWAESIERTSVIYDHHLKEGEGDPVVISYFKKLSDAFFEIESGRTPSVRSRLEIDVAKGETESIIRSRNPANAIDSHVNEDIILTLTEKEKRSASPINNWIIVFDWNAGQFVSWDIVGKTPDEAIAAYVRYENQFPVEKNFEVVLIGSSRVATVRKTHSHYFGIEDYDKILESLDESIQGFESMGVIDVSGRQVLLKLYTKHFWGQKTVAQETLRNHFCKDVKNLAATLDKLVHQGLILRDSASGPVSLNIKARSEIDKLVS